jgi:hypothetical protein
MHFQRQFRKPVGANPVSLALTMISRDGDDYGNLRSGISGDQCPLVTVTDLQRWRPSRRSEI